MNAPGCPTTRLGFSGKAALRDWWRRLVLEALWTAPVDVHAWGTVWGPQCAGNPWHNRFPTQ